MGILKESEFEDGWPQTMVGQEPLSPFAPMYMPHVAGRDLKMRPSKTARARPFGREALSWPAPCHCSSLTSLAFYKRQDTISVVLSAEPSVHTLVSHSPIKPKIWRTPLVCKDTVSLAALLWRRCTPEFAEPVPSFWAYFAVIIWSSLWGEMDGLREPPMAITSTLPMWLFSTLSLMIW